MTGKIFVTRYVLAALVLLCVALVMNVPTRAFGWWQRNYPTEPEYASIQQYDCQMSPDLPQDPDKPNILVIGDSISLQYTPALQVMLGDYNVIHHRCNAAFSAMAAERVHEYLALRDYWAAVIFNVGVWDLNAPEVTVRAYIYNLRNITTAIRRRTNNPIFLTTTAHPNFPEKRQEMNTLAANLMHGLRVDVLDLGGFSEKIVDLRSDDLVHFTDSGSERLASHIAEYIRSRF